MNKKEVLEIRKQFTPENCAITRIVGCYVDHDKEKRMEKTEAFLSLPEEQAFKYFDIFKKTLSGNIGKNLLNLGYAIDVARNGDPEGEAHWMLMELRKSKLTDSNLLDAFYDKIIESYDCAENYYIVLIHAVYLGLGYRRHWKPTVTSSSRRTYTWHCNINIFANTRSYNNL